MTERSKKPTLKGGGRSLPRGPLEPGDEEDNTKVWNGAPTDQLSRPRVTPPVAADDATAAREPPPPMRAISKKTPSFGAASDTPPRALPHVKLRAMAELQSGSRVIPPPAPGRLAPPRNLAEERARKRSELVVWGSISVMIACAIALGIWFLGR